MSPRSSTVTSLLDTPVGARRRVGHEVGDLARRVRVLDVDDAQAVARTRRTGSRCRSPSRTADGSRSSAAAACRRCLRPGSSPTGTGWRSSVMSTTHMKAGTLVVRRGARPRRRPSCSGGRDLERASAARYASGRWNGGDQSRPETNFGFDMSSMSRMTKPRHASSWCRAGCPAAAGGDSGARSSSQVGVSPPAVHCPGIHQRPTSCGLAGSFRSMIITMLPT